MIHKKHSKSHLKIILTDILVLGYSHIEELARTLTRMKGMEDQEGLKNDIQNLSNILTVVNDIIHPAHSISEDMFPDSSDVIKLCRKEHLKVSEKKLIRDKCFCYECSLELK